MGAGYSIAACICYILRSSSGVYYVRYSHILHKNGVIMFADLRAHAWAYPTLSVVHILGIGLLLGNLTMLELRCLAKVSTCP